MDLTLHVGRHRAKDKSVKGVVPGSSEDMNLVHLTPEGWQAALQDGIAGRVIPHDREVIRVQKSPFARVLETTIARLNGAGYDHTNGGVVTFGTSADLGFSGVGFSDELMAVYDCSDFLDVLFRDYFVPMGEHNGKPVLSMAQFMYGSLSAVVEGYEALKRELKEGAKAHLGIECHSDVIDACFAGLTSSVTPSEDGSGVTFGDNYHGRLGGSIKDSEFIVGSTSNGTIDNPKFLFDLTRSDIQRGMGTLVSLDQIKRTRDTAARYAGK